MAIKVDITGTPFNEFMKKVLGFPNNSLIKDDVGKLAAEWFKESFPLSINDNGGRKTDKSASGWEPRKKNYLYPALTKTGKLKNSIHSEKNVVKADAYYASYHNEGTGKLPQRQFIGDSRAMDDKMLKYITDKLTKYLS